MTESDAPEDPEDVLASQAPDAPAKGKEAAAAAAVAAADGVPAVDLSDTLAFMHSRKVRSRALCIRLHAHVCSGRVHVQMLARGALPRMHCCYSLQRGGMHTLNSSLGLQSTRRMRGTYHRTRPWLTWLLFTLLLFLSLLVSIDFDRGPNDLEISLSRKPSVCRGRL